ncbi:MAG TPA: hypothetical protein VJA21_27220 [Verrucomicrobiae bacterium]
MMTTHSHSPLRRQPHSRLVKGAEVGLVVIFVSTTALLCCLTWLACAPATSASLIPSGPGKASVCYFHPGHFLSDARTIGGMLKFILEPETMSITNTKYSG